MRNLDLIVKDTALERIAGINYIIAKKSATKNLFKVSIFLEGKDISFVKEVNYTLHSTFKNNKKKVVRSISNPNCKLVFYAWGTFTVKVQIKTLRGDKIEFSHPLQFGYEVQSGNYNVKFI